MFKPYLEFYFDCWIFKIQTKLLRERVQTDVIDYISIVITFRNWKQFEFRLYSPYSSIEERRGRKKLEDKIKILENENKSLIDSDLIYQKIIKEEIEKIDKISFRFWKLITFFDYKGE